MSIRSLSPAGVIIKIGGSLFSDKARDDGHIDLERIDLFARAVASLAGLAPGRVIVVSGGGSLGHGSLRSAPVLTGSYSGIALTAALAPIRWTWTEALGRHGVRAFPIQLAAICVDTDGQLVTDRVVVGRALESGIVPVLSGDCVMSKKGDLLTISSDRAPRALLPALTGHWRVVVAGDVPGILTTRGGTEVLPVVDPRDPEPARRLVWGEGAHDRTGGMRGKVESLVECAELGAECLLVHGDLVISRPELLLEPLTEWPADIPRTLFAGTVPPAIGAPV